MIVKKFIGGSTREVLQQVRDALGPDALILSSRVNDGTVELMAVAESDMASLTSQPMTQAAPAIRHQIPGLEVMENSAKRPQAPTQNETPAVMRSARTTAPTSTPAPAVTPAVENLAEEVKSIRSLIERQLVNLAWRDMKSAAPTRFDALRTLLGLGFSPRLARQLAGALPQQLDTEQALNWVRGALVHNLRAVAQGQDIISRGGVYALVGPTGVGKTTTVAKLAARCVLKHGPSQLALITTDSYRIGAHEQLKIYGKILNVPVYAVKDADDLTRTLKDLQDRHLVLIDTAGMSQRDRRIAEQIALLTGPGRPIQRLLLLAATSQPGTLDDVVRAYQGQGLAGILLTKLDESVALAPVLDVAIRHKLAVHYVTNGQRVPEDLHRAHAPYLVDRAFKREPEATHVPREEEFPLIISAHEDDARAFLHDLPPNA